MKERKPDGCVLRANYCAASIYHSCVTSGKYDNGSLRTKAAYRIDLYTFYIPCIFQRDARQSYRLLSNESDLLTVPLGSVGKDNPKSSGEQF